MGIFFLASKATTVKSATDLSWKDFTIDPQTEGEIATYSITITPTSAFTSTAIIFLEFPYYFAKDLGNKFRC